MDKVTHFVTCYFYPTDFISFHVYHTVMALSQPSQATISMNVECRNSSYMELESCGRLRMIWTRSHILLLAICTPQTLSAFTFITMSDLVGSCLLIHCQLYGDFFAQTENSNCYSCFALFVEATSLVHNGEFVLLGRNLIPWTGRKDYFVLLLWYLFPHCYNKSD
jgi:hypothetical protein